MGFADFLGNANTLATIRAVLARGSVPGSLLFAGPDGVGKKTLAWMLAKAVNCERMNDDFCGRCARCRKAEEMLSLAREDLARRREMKDASRRVDGLIYFDLQLIEPLTRFILIEQIRQLREVAYTRPFEFTRRVFIIDQAQTIHWQALDLLLKVMEEPPDTSTLILVCPNPYELRLTLRSRCHRIQFQPVEDSAVESILKNERRVPPSQLALTTRVVAGSIAAAKSFELAGFQARRRPWISFLDSVAMKEWSSMTGADWKALFDSAKALAEDRSALQETLTIGYTLLRDLLQVLEENGERVVNLDLMPRLKAWAPKIGLEGVEKLKIGLDEAYRFQIRNVNQQLAWEALAMELIEQ